MRLRACVRACVHARVKDKRRERKSWHAQPPDVCGACRTQTVEITGQAEPISRPEKPPVPEAVPPENVEKKKRQRSRKKRVTDLPAEEGPKGINFVEGTTLDDGLLAKATKEGEGFLAALSLFRNSEKVDERQDEMDALDPRKREEQKAKYAEEDRAAKEKNKPNFKIKKKVVAAPKTFGVPLAKLEKADLEDGQTVPRVLQLLSKWIQANGGLGMPSLFTPEPAADIGKECKDVRARLDQLDYTPCTNPRVCAQLLLEWCRDFPGGLLAGLPDGLLSELEDGEAAIEAIGQLPEEVQVWIPTMRVELTGHCEPCMADIYLHIYARTADYIHTHPYTLDTTNLLFVSVLLCS